MTKTEQKLFALRQKVQELKIPPPCLTPTTKAR